MKNKHIYNKKIYRRIPNYKFYIDYENLVKESSQYKRYTDAIATTNIISIKIIIEKFKIKYYNLKEIEQDLYDYERILLKDNTREDYIFFILKEEFKLNNRKLTYLLNKIDAKFYICEDKFGTLPPRAFKNKYTNRI